MSLAQAENAPSARFSLKARTREDHERLDALFDRLDLTRVDDLGHFLLAHRHALEAVDAMTDGYHALLPSLRPPDLRPALDEDLAALSLGGPIEKPLPNDASGEMQALGVAYVVAGSRLGAKILRRRWAAATDPRVKAAGAYLASESYDDYWPRLVQKLDRYAEDETAIAAMHDAASATFALFTTAFHDAAKRLP